MKRTRLPGDLNRRYLNTLIVTGGIRPILRHKRAPMAYRRERFTWIFAITLICLLITIVLNLKGIIQAMLIALGLIALVIIAARRARAGKTPGITGGTDNDRGWFGKL